MKTQQLLTSIAEAVFSQAGERFFHSLVELLASTLQVRFSFMCHMLGHNSELFESFAFWDDKKNQGGIHRRTLERLCEKIETGVKMIGASDIQSLFPDDPWIRDAGIQSCCMIPLFDNAGNLLGQLGVFDDKPLEDREQTVATLGIFATHASAEIERQRAEQKLQESEECFRAISSAALCGIIMMDKGYLLHTTCNLTRSASGMFEQGLRRDMVGLNGLLHESIKKHPTGARSASIKTKRELIEIVGKVLHADAPLERAE